MRLKLTPAQLQEQPAVLEVLFSKMLEKVEWGGDDLTHGQVQYCLDNDIVLDKAVLFSPILTEGQLNAEVPLTWPDSTVLNEEGEVISRKVFGDYLRSTEVVGGIVLQYSGGPKDSNNSIILPTYSQLLAQISLAGGFLTKGEVDAIKIVEVEDV